MKKIFLLMMAIMALVFSGVAQEIDLDDALEEQPVVVFNVPVSAPTTVVSPTTTVGSPAPAKPAVVQPVTNEPTVKVQTVDYSQLSPEQKVKLSEFARMAAYGTLITTDLTGCDITSVTTVTNVPSRSGRRMTQYVVMYLDQSRVKHGIIMTENPLVNGGCTPCYIKCMVATPGYHQGDDKSIPQKPKSGENHKISQDW